MVTKNLIDFTAAWRIDISYDCPLNVINYKHETHALAYTFKAGSWQI